MLCLNFHVSLTSQFISAFNVYGDGGGIVGTANKSVTG